MEVAVEQRPGVLVEKAETWAAGFLEDRVAREGDFHITKEFSKPDSQERMFVNLAVVGEFPQIVQMANFALNEFHPRKNRARLCANPRPSAWFSCVRLSSEGAREVGCSHVWGSHHKETFMQQFSWLPDGLIAASPRGAWPANPKT
jgi:hypothetical protein